MALVYKLTFPNDKIYIGMVTKPGKTAQERLIEHGRDAKKRKSYPVRYAVNKYGIKAVQVDILLETDSDDLAALYEHEVIEFLGARIRTVGYNVAPGGKGGCIGWYKRLPDDQKVEVSSRLSAASSARPRESWVRGDDHPMYGRTHAPAVRAKMSEKVLASGYCNSEANLHHISTLTRKFTRDQYDSIRELIMVGAIDSDISEMFEISESTVRLLRYGKHWSCRNRQPSGIPSTTAASSLPPAPM